MTASQAAKESSKQSMPTTPKFEIHQKISSGVSRKNSKKDLISCDVGINQRRIPRE
jgi:hypothetical protein